MINTEDLPVDSMGHASIRAAVGLERALRACQIIFESRSDIAHVSDWVQQVLDGADSSEISTKRGPAMASTDHSPFGEEATA